MQNAPKDATHYGITSTGNICFYKLEGDTWYFLYANAAEKGGVWCRVWDNNPFHTPLTEIKQTPHTGGILRLVYSTKEASK